ncbi:XRE family transcriptional regulator [Subtercola boreus]|uniref:XRE family transcriptional regulator n=1 Tax=Subtercola boreus TaxID=120213 RepID=A0A3E0VH26_9MICO|nr:XRE family transcriptional regulator [Subtercola boreus]RFA09242.1 XRE family transcriptional regulator [Subtercola boreus]TQL53732.1 XRE family transcriptional regulator [Subtercola boreus]
MVAPATSRTRTGPADPATGPTADTTADKTADVLAGVGARLRALRTARSITLAELSAETGVSVSTLSRLESGQRRPVLELLLPLARAYGVPLDDLVGAPPTGDPRIHLTPIRHGSQTIIPLSRGATGLQAFKHVIAGSAPAAQQAPDPKTHEGFEWIYVLRGNLRLVLGEHDFVLAAGEAAEFDTHTPHWFGPADTRAVEFLSLFGRQGERMHVRATPARR